MVPTFFAILLSISTALASSPSSPSSSSLDSSPFEHPNPLLKRQSEAFIPSTTHANGKTCADAFGPGYVRCGTGIKCVNPDRGQTCCSGGYGCPRNSFCLVKGYCCPNGLSPESCALSHSVTLPADFTTAGVAVSIVTTPSTSIGLTVGTSTSTSRSRSVSTATSSVVAFLPIPTFVDTAPTVGAGSAWRAVGAGEGGMGVWGLVALVGVLGVVGGVL